MLHVCEGYQTQSLFFSDRQTIEPAPKAHKPADSGVPVAIDARNCSFQEVKLTAIKQAPQLPSVANHLQDTQNQTVGAGLLAMGPEQPPTAISPSRQIVPSEHDFSYSHSAPKPGPVLRVTRKHPI